jgi:hypothetical protein
VDQLSAGGSQQSGHAYGCLLAYELGSVLIALVALIPFDLGDEPNGRSWRASTGDLLMAESRIGVR